MELLGQSKNSLTGFSGSPYRNYLDLTAAGSQHGTFDPVTLRGDFKIRFKAICDGAAGWDMVLGNTAGGNHLIGFDGANFKMRLDNAVNGEKIFGTYTTNKLITVEIVRTGMKAVCEIDGAQVGTAYICPGDFVLDKAFAGAGFYFDNVIADLEIIDLDQPATRDVLTLESAGSMYATGDAWNPDGSDIVLEFEVVGKDGAATQYLYDSRNGSGMDGGFVYVSSTGIVTAGANGVCSWTSVLKYIDGVSGSDIPNDGKRHTVKITATQTGASSNPIKLGAAWTLSGLFLDTALLGAKLHDLTTPSNSRRFRFDTASSSYVLDSYGVIGDELAWSDGSLTATDFDSNTAYAIQDLGDRLRITRTSEPYATLNLLTDSVISPGADHEIRFEIIGISAGATAYYAATNGGASTLISNTYPTTPLAVHLVKQPDGTGNGKVQMRLAPARSSAPNNALEGDWIEISKTITVREVSPTYLTLNNITLNEWQAVERQSNGDLVGPDSTLEDPNYTAPADILWPIKSGKGYELNKRKAVGPELVVNGDNEAGLMTNLAGDPPSTTRGVISQSTNQVQSGSYSAQYLCNDATSGSHYIHMGAVPANTAIVISGWAYHPSGGIGKVAAIDVDDGSFIKSLTTSTDTWEYFSLLRPAKATQWNLSFGDNVSSSIDGESFYLDNISVREVQNPLTYVNIIESDWEKYRKKGRDWVNQYWPNLLSWSEDFGNGVWGKVRGDLVANATTAPDGTVTADKITSNDAAETYWLQTPPPVAGPVTQTCYIKKDTADFAHMLAWDTSANGVRAWFDISTGVVGVTASFGTGWTVSDNSIIDVGNGWYRCSATYSTTGSTLSCRVSMSDGDGAIASAVGKSAFFWGAQLNEGATALPYRKTEGVTAKILEAP